MINALPGLTSKTTEDCALCSKIIKNPVSIPCGHLFCSKCLNDYARPKRTAVRECPTCEAKFYNVPSADLKEIRAELKKKGIPKDVRAFFNDPVRKVHYDFHDERKRTDDEIEKLEKLINAMKVALSRHKEAEGQAKAHVKHFKEELGEAEKRVKALTDANYDLDWEMKEQEQHHIQAVRLLNSKHVETESALTADLEEALAEVNRLTIALQEKESHHRDYCNALEVLQEANESITEEYTSKIQSMEQSHELALQEINSIRMQFWEFRQNLEEERIAREIACLGAQKATHEHLLNVMFYGCMI